MSKTIDIRLLGIEVVRMYKIFLSSEHHGTVRRNEIEPGCWIAMTAPSADELQTVASECSIQLEDLRAALDDEERSRIQVEDDYTLIVVDIPVIEERNGKDWYGTIPLGIAVTDSQIITICLEDTPVLNNFMDGRVREFYTYKKTRFILQILYRNATLFLNYLRNIDKRSELLEKKLREDQKNKELLELQELEKSLVYFTTSLKGNELVLEKLFRIDKIKKYPEDEDLLEDVIVENKQAIEMASIYSGILSGSMVDEVSCHSYDSTFYPDYGGELLRNECVYIRNAVCRQPVWLPDSHRIFHNPVIYCVDYLLEEGFVLEADGCQAYASGL